ncbi:MAG: hypothetical protein L0Y71_10165 [Gemmataceae bacterium]|nr:hypothetical protein [Gemmataceae bacterium]
MQAGRRYPLLLALLGSLLLAGCKSRELVENELRARDIQYREAMEELGRTEAQNQALQRELEALRRGAHIPPEQAAQLFGVKRLALGRMTGGYDNDGRAGDEALQVILEPRDGADHSIKAPGQAVITALEIHPQGIKTPIGEWVVGPDQLRRTWKQGLLSTGYALILPWKTFPQSENVRVVARLILADNRVFEADKDVRVRVAPGMRPPEVLPGEPVPGALGPHGSGPPLIPALKQPYPNMPVGVWVPPPLDRAIQVGRPIPQVPQAPQADWPAFE